MNAENIAEQLEALSTEEMARASRKQVSTLRGVRGTPLGEVARILAETWKATPTRLPLHEEVLETLFSTAWEDGLIAVGLLAAATPDSPAEVLDIARGWLDRVDDVVTADALGWLAIGPAALASGAKLAPLFSELRSSPHPATRRAAVLTGMAMTPTRLEGPSAAALRERLGAKDIQFVSSSLKGPLEALASAFVRDEDAGVRKGLRRVLGSWALDAPDDAEHWMNTFPGGVPKMIREEVEHAAKKGRRKSG